MTDAAPSSTKRESYRTELETIRSAYHALAASLTPEDFRAKSGNASWTVGQLMWHLAWGLGYVPNLVERSRKGKDLRLPRGLFNAINPWLTRWGARGVTRDKALRLYDEANAKALAALETVQDDEWDRTASITGNVQSVEDHFRMPGEHFAEHQADILKGLGRA